MPTPDNDLLLHHGVHRSHHHMSAVDAVDDMSADAEERGASYDLTTASSPASYDIRETEVYGRFFAKGKHLVDMEWTRTRIGSAEEDGRIAVDILTTSRTVKGLDKCPHDVLFRTHQYEFRIMPNEAFFSYMGVRYGYMLEMSLYRRRDAGSTSTSASPSARQTQQRRGSSATAAPPAIQDEVPGTQLDDLEQFDLFTNCGQPIILVSMQEDVDTHSWVVNLTWTRNTKISLKGDFCLRIDCYRKIDGDTLKRAFSVVSNPFIILSKPLVYANMEKRQQKNKSSSSSSSSKKGARDNTSKKSSGSSSRKKKQQQRPLANVDNEREHQHHSAEKVVVVEQREEEEEISKRRRKRELNAKDEGEAQDLKQQNGRQRSRASAPVSGKRKRLRISSRSDGDDDGEFIVERQPQEQPKQRRIQISSGINAAEIPDADLLRYPETFAIDEVSEIQQQQQQQEREHIATELGCGLSLTKENDYAYTFTGSGGHISNNSDGPLISDSLNAMLESFMQNPQLTTTDSQEYALATTTAADSVLETSTDPKHMIALNVDGSGKSGQADTKPTEHRDKVQKAKKVMAEVEEQNSASLFRFHDLQSNMAGTTTTTTTEASSVSSQQQQQQQQLQQLQQQQEEHKVPQDTTLFSSPVFSPFRNITGGDGNANSALRLGMLSALTTPRGLLSLSFEPAANAESLLFSNSQQQQPGGGQDMEMTGSQQYDHLWQSVAEREGSPVWEQLPQNDDDSIDEGELFNSQRSFYNRYRE